MESMFGETQDSSSKRKNVISRRVITMEDVEEFICKCPLDKLLYLSDDINGKKIFYCKKCAEFRKSD